MYQPSTDIIPRAYVLFLYVNIYIYERKIENVSKEPKKEYSKNE